MTKEEQFIKYLDAIKDLAIDIGMCENEISDKKLEKMEKELEKLKKEFYEWFKKHLSTN